MLLTLFFVIVLSPCVAAYFSRREESPGPLGDPPARPGSDAGADPPGGQQAMLEEVPLGENLVIRSFPKGLSQRRILVQDTVAGVRLTIMQLRERLRRAGITARRFALAMQRPAESRAALLKRLAEQARATWSQSAAQRMRALRLASGEHRDWDSGDAYERLRWQELGAAERGFRAA